MADKQEHDSKNIEPKEKNKKVTKASIIGAIVVLLCLSGGGYIWYKNVQKPSAQVEVNSAIGTVNIEKVLAQHSNYAKLEKLQAEKVLILSKLKSYTLNNENLAPPEVNPAEQVFNQVVDEQDNLREIKTRQQLKEESITKENEIRQNLAEEKNKAVEAINSKYTNAILNCTLKLDNAENLNLSAAEKEKLLSILGQLKRERGNMVLALEQQYNLRVADELISWRNQREHELGLSNQQGHQQDVQDSLAKQQQEQARDNQYLQDRLQMLKARKKDSERLVVLLHTKENEINLLRKSMLKDIASRATKIAIQKHLKMVVTDVPMNMDLFGNIRIDNFDENILNGMVVGVDAIDITDDVIAELTTN